ncbi:MAG: hypothetical protein A3F40_00015 [Chlamydiae bacterium RIFCSPHIGHO2_12_FULL_27_8]|nr:MAG: hypothetical protein A3F40_00015 [Chlamydiae bacterium RIFCSPHIGHO2_12_FULL_27_8]
MKKKIYIILLSVLIFLLIIFSFIPQILSSISFKKLIIKKIEKKFDSKIEIDNLNFSWFGPQKILNIKYIDKNINASTESIISNMSFFSFYKALKTTEKLPFLAHTKINNLNIDLHFEDMPKVSFYNIYTDIKSQNNDFNIFEITGKTTEDKFQGNFSIYMEMNREIINLKANGLAIPTVGIDNIVFYKSKKLKGIIYALLGSNMNIDIDAKITNFKGPVNINIISSNAEAKLNLLYQDGNVSLVKPAFLQFHLNANTKKIIKGIDFVKTYANSPLSLQISNHDFEIPVKKFLLNKVLIKNMILDPGRLLVSNTGAIRSIMNFSKMGNPKEVQIWSTFVNTRVEDSIFYFDRIDLLIENELHLCFWGKINLKTQALNMNMGLTQDTLETLFGITSVADDYVLKVPVKGTLDDPKVDMSKAAAKILALSALEQGKGIGKIIGGVVSKMQNDSDIPPPKRPFPWEGKVLKKKKETPLNPENFFKIF